MSNISFSIGESLLSSVGAYSTRIAISTADGQNLSFSALHEKTDKIAQFLSALGVKKGDRVGIFMGKSLEQVMSIYGVAKAAGIFVLINNKLKQDQVNYICNHCGIKILMADSVCIQLMGKSICSKTSIEKIVSVDQYGGTNGIALCNLKEAFDKRLETVDLPRVIGEDIASIIYTSGSTGKPKGVAVTNRNIMDAADIGWRYLNINENDKMLSLLPFNFDYGLNQLISSIKYGAQLYLSELIFEKDVFASIEKFQITGIFGIPTIWVRLASSPFSKTYNLSSLRYIVNSGGKLPKTYVYKLIEMLPKAEIFLRYGQTESFCSTYLPSSLVKEKPESIGKALPNVEVFVINPDGDICKPREKGEIVHRGALISRGYWNDPEATDKIIRTLQLPNMVSAERVVFSGDEGFMDEDGYIYFTGRKSELIKSSGFRISPTEIEEVLYIDLDVKGAVVFGIEDDEFGQKIKAVIQTSLNPQEAIGRVKQLCIIKLPTYMQPHFYEVMPSMPLTASGKIDRGKIKQLYGEIRTE